MLRLAKAIISRPRRLFRQWFGLALNNNEQFLTNKHFQKGVVMQYKLIFNTVAIVAVLVSMLGLAGCWNPIDEDEDGSENRGGGTATPYDTTSFVDSRDGKRYKAVKIGTQRWMAENLNYNASGSLCAGNSSANCATYGRLYNLEAAKTACPVGWHLPNDEEWTVLKDYVGGGSTAGSKLKSTSGWYNNGNGTDKYGFSALPGGFWDQSSSNFVNVGHSGIWWSATERSDSYASNQTMHYGIDPMAIFTGIDNTNLLSVRCVEGGEEIPPPPPESDETFVDSRDGKSYKKVTIGSQIWMAENLNYAAEGSKCYGEGGEVYEYDDNIDDWIGGRTLTNSEIQANCEKYGRLYDWTTAMNGAGISIDVPSGVQGVCPAGWHLPSSAEWDTLENYVGGWETAGTKLKSSTGWYNNGNGTDDFGFSALPGGVGNDGDFFSAGLVGGWWSTFAVLLYGDGATFVQYIEYDKELMRISPYDVRYLFSVRCLQD